MGEWCIYFQDELGFCCKDGSGWSKMTEESRCGSKRHETCKIKITIADVEKMKQKLEAIRELVKYKHSLTLVNQIKGVLGDE